MPALREQIYGGNGFGDINFYAVDYPWDLREMRAIEDEINFAAGCFVPRYEKNTRYLWEILFPEKSSFEKLSRNFTCRKALHTFMLFISNFFLIKGPI